MQPNITAVVIQDSVCKTNRVTTFELEYPRFIHAELMTHRMFSRNAASSRAIPVEKMIQHVLECPAVPVYWGANQPGMQAKAELEGIAKEDAKDAWKEAIRSGVKSAKELLATGLHKQIANRVTEPFQTMKTIVTATEYTNWFWLREHTDAQPEIRVLAEAMKTALNNSKPLEILSGEWHVPYVDRVFEPEYHDLVYRIEGMPASLDDAKIISASCCAQVSYRKTDDSLDKAKKVFDRLINSVPVHASPIEHQCTPMQYANTDMNNTPWEPGITHVDRKGNYWSGNFKGFIQFRQLMESQ